MSIRYDNVQGLWKNKVVTRWLVKKDNDVTFSVFGILLRCKMYDGRRKMFDNQNENDNENKLGRELF